MREGCELEEERDRWSPGVTTTPDGPSRYVDTSRKQGWKQGWKQEQGCDMRKGDDGHKALISCYFAYERTLSSEAFTSSLTTVLS